MLSTSSGTAGLTPQFCEGGPKKHFIGGEWVPSISGETFSTINPSTGKVLAEVAKGSAEDVDRAVAAARQAFHGPWSRFTPVQRQDVLLHLADLLYENFEELRHLDSHEMGMPLGSGNSHKRDWVRKVLRYYAGWTTKIEGQTMTTSAPGEVFTYTRQEPVGVVGGITPWNSPLGVTLYKIAPVLATGCTLVLKPSELASLSPLRIGEFIQELDLPAGVINIVTGDGGTGEALSRHPGVDKVAFTGSPVTGQKVIQAATGNLKRVSLELGGKSPNIVFADADIEKAINGAAMGVFFNTGQSCTAGTRIYVERPIYEAFVDGIAGVADSLKVGNALDPSTQIGPIVSQSQLDRVTDYCQIGVGEGARPIIGGSRLAEGDLANGYFVPPTVFADVRDDMRIAREEIFGPVASVMPFDDFDEVARRANDTKYGLAAGVWTRDIGKAHRMSEALQSGMVWINTYLTLDIAVPFGGYKMSGWGREGGRHGLDEFLNLKTVWLDLD